MQGKFTGWHMLGVMVAFFGVVIAVNVTMARIAIGSFGGVVVENSYIATQEFNGWLDQAEQQQALGWEVTQALREDGRVGVQVAGAPDTLVISGMARHPLGVADSHDLAFISDGEGGYISASALPEGRWVLRLSVKSLTDEWRGEEELR